MQKAEPSCKRVAFTIGNKGCPLSAVKFPSCSLPAMNHRHRARGEQDDNTPLVGKSAGLAALQARREGREEAQKFNPVPFS